MNPAGGRFRTINADVGYMKTILYVEDDHIIALFTERLLRKQGYYVLGARSGTEAICTLGDNPFVDLIILDIDLGEGINGIETAELINEVYNIPILFLSGHTDLGIISKAMECSPVDYIVKNGSDHALMASIKKALDEGNMRKGLDSYKN